MPIPADLLLRAVPDEPRWIDSRGLLLTGRYRVDLDSAEAAIVDRGGVPTSFAVASTDFPFAGVVGRPSPDVVSRTVDGLADGAEVLVQRGSKEHLETALAGWVSVRVLAHRLPRTFEEAWPEGSANAEPDERLRMLGARDRSLLQHLPDDLHRELATVLEYAPIASWFEEGRPVAFCAPALWTETLWDISVNTLEPWRGRGLAGRCTRFMATHEVFRGRQPVWSAHETNQASLRVAQKLGFEPVQSFWSLHRPTSSPMDEELP